MGSKGPIFRSLITSIALILAQFTISNSAANASVSTTYNPANAGTWTVPAGVTSIQVTAYGGGGGTGGTDGAGNISRQPGNRGLITTTFAVTKGDVIGIYPGRKGGNGSSSVTNSGGGAAGSSTYSPSYNGGTGGNAGASGSSGAGGGGGAATLLRINSSTVLVAGGSGGGGGAANISGSGRDGYNTHLANGTSTTGQNGRQTTSASCGKTDGGGSGAGGGGTYGGQSGGLQAEGSECWGFGGYPGNNWVSGGSSISTSFTSTGKTSDGQIIIAYTVETTPPVSSGSVASNYLTSGNTVSVSFTASDASGIQSVTVYYSINSNLSSPTSCGTYTGANTSGSITCTLPSTDRTYYLYTRAVDQAGNTEAAPGTADAVVTRDTVKPASTMAIADAYLNSGTTVNFTYTSSDATSGVAQVQFYYSTNSNLTSPTLCRTLSGGEVAASGSSSCTIPSTDATYYFYSLATDNAGLIQDAPGSTTASIIRDTVAPNTASAISLNSSSDTGQSNSDRVTNDSTPTFDLTFSESNISVQLFANGGAISSACNFASTSGQCTTNSLSDGTYEITAKATDQAGNVSLESSAVTVTIDTQAPTVTVSQDLPNPYSERNIIFTFTFSKPIYGFDPLSVSDLTLSEAGFSRNSSTGSDGDSTYTLTVTNSSPTNNSTITATVISNSVTDLAGNSGPAANTDGARTVNRLVTKTKWLQFIWGEILTKF